MAMSYLNIKLLPSYHHLSLKGPLNLVWSFNTYILKTNTRNDLRRHPNWNNFKWSSLERTPMFSGSPMDGLWQHQDVKTPKKCLVYPPGTTADMLIGGCTTTKPPSQTSSCPLGFLLISSPEIHVSDFQPLVGTTNRVCQQVAAISGHFEHRAIPTWGIHIFLRENLGTLRAIKSHHQTRHDKISGKPVLPNKGHCQQLPRLGPIPL